ncbi:MAG: hypothetical protein I3I94_06760 [Acidaminococcaceae bacterium]|nr:hypothetical protein [Acidaminococcaceae bacterium]HCJ90642.1 YqeG family HAD IIIA-type phosphatase [Acidaminococcaceae bacterium]
MLDLLVPEYRFSSLTVLTPAWLRRNRYGGIILDLDNTFLRRDSLTPETEHLEWIRILESGGIAVVLVSNNGGRRVEEVRRLTGIPVVDWACKPLNRAFRKARALLPAGLSLLVVGDQLFTDVLGAHLVGLPAALVPSLGSREFVFTRCMRRLEGVVINRLADAGRWPGEQ